MQGDNQLLLESCDSYTSQLSALGTPMAEFAFRGRWLRLLAFLLVGHLCWAFLVPDAVIYWHAFAAFMGVREIAWAYHHRRVRIVVIPEGMVHLQPGQAKAFFWEEIAIVEQKFRVDAWERKVAGFWCTVGFFLIKGATTWYIVRREDGDEIKFDTTLPRYKKLLDLIRAETLPPLFHSALASYEGGNGVPFGPLTVSQHGLSKGTDSLPWDGVKKIVVDDHRVLVVKKRKWLPLMFDTPWYQGSSSSFVNLHVFRALADEILEDRDSAKAKG
jgi:hypothetical protein